MSWFEDLVGFPEQTPDQVRANLEIVEGSLLKSKLTGATFRCGNLDTPSLEELRERTSKLRENSGNPISVTEVVGDVQELHQAEENDGALFQVASQFNLLEMVGPEVTPEQGVGIYEYDRTQGPACAIACGAATIFRNYFVEVERGQIGQTADNQIDCLRDLGAALGNRDNSLWRMSNGYALASEAGLKKVSKALHAAEGPLDSLRAKLRIGVQSETGVTLENYAKADPNRVTQAFCSAVPVAYSDQSSELWEPLARLVLEAAYEATLHLGVLNQEKTGSSQVFLTSLGGGAFGNPTEWITSAVERAVRRFPHSGLDVRIVSYGGLSLPRFRRHPGSHGSAVGVSTKPGQAQTTGCEPSVAITATVNRPGGATFIGSAWTSASLAATSRRVRAALSSRQGHLRGPAAFRPLVDRALPLPSSLRHNFPSSNDLDPNWGERRGLDSADFLSA